MKPCILDLPGFREGARFQIVAEDIQAVDYLPGDATLVYLRGIAQPFRCAERVYVWLLESVAPRATTYRLP